MTSDADAQPLRAYEAPIPCLFMQPIPKCHRYACGYTGELCNRASEFWNCGTYRDHIHGNLTMAEKIEADRAAKLRGGLL